eukprot:9468406-Pyramimonas_sp.AAC.1
MAIFLPLEHLCLAEGPLLSEDGFETLAPVHVLDALRHEIPLKPGRAMRRRRMTTTGWRGGVRIRRTDDEEKNEKDPVRMGRRMRRKG